MISLISCFKLFYRLRDKLIDDIVVFLTQYTEIDLVKTSLYLKSILTKTLLK